MKELKLFFTVFKQDWLRITLLLVLGFAFLRPDAALMEMVGFSFGLSFLLLAMSHVARKILFRHIDLAEYSDAALKGNVAAALIFAAVTFALCVLMLVIALPLLAR